MSGVLRWEQPGDARRNAWDETWRQVADELRAKPREWALIHESNRDEAPGLTQNVKHGRGPFAPRGAFDAVSRTVTVDGKKVFRAYARYVGDPR